MEVREQHEKEQAGIIKRLEKTVNELKREVVDKGEMIKKLEEKVNRIERQGAAGVGGDRKMGGAVRGKPEYIDIGDDDI